MQPLLLAPRPSSRYTSTVSQRILILSLRLRESMACECSKMQLKRMVHDTKAAASAGTVTRWHGVSTLAKTWGLWVTLAL